MKKIDAVIILTSFPDGIDLSGFWRELLQERLVACVTTLGKSESIYRWEEKIEEAKEQSVLIKTTRDKVESIDARIKQFHPYEVPELIVVPVIDGNVDYLNWVANSTGLNNQ